MNVPATNDLSPSVKDALDLANAVVEGRRAGADLLPVLHETSMVYEGLGSDACERLRGVFLSALEHANWSGALMGIVLEELRTSYHPAGLMGAALALRGCETAPPDGLDSVVEAFDRCIEIDRQFDPRTFAVSRNYPEAMTVSQELALTFCALSKRRPAPERLLDQMQKSASRLKPRRAAEIHQLLKTAQIDTQHKSPCCGGSPGDVNGRRTLSGSLPKSVLVLDAETQDGRRAALGELFGNRPTLLAFFYTRCMNPLKCSSTITRLAQLQTRLRGQALENKVNLFAITYDPEFDTAERLRRYGVDRGLDFNATCSLVRLSDGNGTLLKALDILVGYGPSTVNRHGLNAFIVDRDGSIIHSYERELFDPDHALDVMSSILLG